jgi:hypothetical protein
MTQLVSYEAAKDLFAKARKPSAGKPLPAKGWRLFKDGDEYIAYHFATQVARFLPDNTLRLLVPATGVSQLVPHTIHNVLPVRYVRRSNAHYRVRPVVSGTSTEFISYDYRLYDGLTIDLTAGLAPNYREPQIVTDPVARQDWLAKSKALKTYLKTIVKLGGFTARIEVLRDSGATRWDFPIMSYRVSEDVAIIRAALNGDDMERVVQRVAEDMFRTFYKTPDTTEQMKLIDTIISKHSHALRTALGVITEA